MKLSKEEAPKTKCLPKIDTSFESRLKKREMRHPLKILKAS